MRKRRGANFMSAKTSKCGQEALVHGGALGKSHRGCLRGYTCRWVGRG